MTFLPPRQVSIPPEGDPTSPIAVVGEAGGAWEERLRRPFVGPAGTVLEQSLHSAGLTRAQIYLTNLLKFRPNAKNDISAWWKPKVGFSKEGYAACQELREELDSIGAKVVVPVGNCPLYALTGKEGIMKQRGSPLEPCWNGREMRIIPTIHPAACLWGAKRDTGETGGGYIWRYWIAHDLMKAKRHAYGQVQLPQRELIVDPSFDETVAWLEYYLTQPRFAFDIEVTNYEVSCISFCSDPLRSVSIPMYGKWTESEETAVWERIERVLTNPDSTKICQNTIFDVGFLAQRNHILTQGRLEDTMCAQSIMWPDFPMGLDFITSIYTDEPYYKDEGKKHFKLPTDWLQFRRYNAKDSAVTLESWLQLEEEMDKTGYRDIYERTVELFHPLIFMSINGIRVDEEALNAARKEIEEQLEERQKALNQACGRPLNANSPKDCQQYFYVEKGIPPYTHHKTGRVTTDDKAMARIARGTSARKPLREASLIQQVRALRKLQGTYLEIEFDEDKRFRSAYNPRGATTGRLSSSKTIFDTGTNAQFLPETFLGFLQADPGFVLVSADKVQAEWVATAYIANDANMLKVLREGRDPHVATAAMMTGIDPALIVKEDKYVKHLTDPGEIAAIRARLFPDIGKGARFLPRNMGVRQCGKKSNHGLDYGEGFARYALENEVPEAEAKIVVELYHSIYPGIRQWYQRVQHLLGKDRTLVGPAPFRRKRRFLNQWGQELFKQAYAFLPQGAVVDVVNDALKKAYYSKEDFMWPLQTLQQVHDSIVWQYPLSAGYENLYMAIELCKQFLAIELEYEGRKFTIGTEVKFGFNLGSMHTLEELGKLSDEAEAKLPNGEDLKRLAGELSTIHRRNGAPTVLSHVGRN